MSQLSAIAAAGSALLLSGCVVPIVVPLPGSAPEQAEPFRPAFHYTPPTGWMNDPNGLVYDRGEWHMFYQYYPDHTVWGPMHWGHATSRDLVDWQTLPVALAPGPEGYIFSGSAVVDRRDTAGFGRDAMVAIYTIHDPERATAGTRDHESQGIASSLDDGRTFTKFAGNPVLANPGETQDFRDPNVFRDEARNRWVMSLSVSDHVRFYASPDLKTWTFHSSFGTGLGAHGGVWECPNLFPITDEASGRTRWVLIQNLNPGGPQGGSGTQYFVGDWDGERFTIDPAFEAPAWLDEGADNYAGITWEDAPASRRVFIGWMSNWLYAQQVPTQAWRSAMTVPRELSLHGLELRQAPVIELEDLRDGPATEAWTDIAGPLPLAEYDLTFRLPGEGAPVSLTFANDAGERLVVGLDEHNRWFVDRREAGASDFAEGFAAIHYAPRKHAGQTARIRLLLDQSSLELFTDDGATVMTEVFFASEPFNRARLDLGGGVQLVEGSGWRLRPAEISL